MPNWVNLKVIGTADVLCSAAKPIIFVFANSVTNLYQEENKNVIHSI